ncbi:MAG: EAL domain-containing protein [Gammaproteobacteria bacterium]|jgi:diguanylate cyclase (GGDEF)-like protein/PAS domain S-box-containing protein
MYEDYENDGNSLQAGARHDSPATPEPEHGTDTERRAINRWQFRADQLQLLYQQVQTELIISMLMAAIVGAVFWKPAPAGLLLGWAICTVIAAGIRSLFISTSRTDDNSDEISGWGNRYIAGVMISGICWGSLGIIAAVYGELAHQMFVLFVLAGISLTTYVSMQSSPRTIATFITPSLLPITMWFFYQGGIIQLALGIITVIFATVMLFSSRSMRKILAKSFSLGSHNTELIKKLVTTRESAENAKRYAEKANLNLQEEIKVRQRAEDQIRASEQRMTAIFDSMQDTIYQTDRDDKIVWITPSIEQLLGYAVEDVLNLKITDLYVCTSEYEDLKHALDSNYGRMQHFETRLLHKNGSHIWISENSHYRHGRHGEVIGIEGTIRNITALKHAKEALHQEKERAQVTLGSIGDGVITSDMNGNIEYMNKVAEQATGWKLKDARGRPMMDVFRIVDEKTLEAPPNPVDTCLSQGKSSMLAGYLLLIHRHRNQRLSIELNASPIRDSNADITGVVLVFHDVTELRGLAKKMSYQATHDSLTGLINRREFENRLNHAIESTRNSGTRHALCYMDLDNFKIVNDTCGHTAGDELLKQLTIKLRMELREADTLARLGGDEFGILLEGCSIENAWEPAETIRQVVEDFRFVWDNRSFRIGASIGLVPITSDSGTLSDILSAADSACYVAKDRGRNCIHVYEPDDEIMAERHGQMQWVQRIQDVLEHNRFRLYFQPIARLDNTQGEKNTTHGEVLIRLVGDNDEIVGPGSFIPSAERYCLMPAIDRWVITNTFRALTLDINRVLQRVTSCCINLSGQSLSDERFMEFLVNEISGSGVPPEILCFEITETAVIANLCNASTLITTLREMGCRFALDDFGVGLSSFGYLKNLLVDYLKLDGCFIKNMVKDNIDRAMVEAINQIGHTMQIKTIAEFVEDTDTLAAVRDVGIDYAQGYAIAKPVPIEIGLYSDPLDAGILLEENRPVNLKTASGNN